MSGESPSIRWASFGSPRWPAPPARPTGGGSSSPVKRDCPTTTSPRSIRDPTAWFGLARGSAPSALTGNSGLTGRVGVGCRMTRFATSSSTQTATPGSRLAGGVGLIQKRMMTLAEKARFYEDELEKYIRRTPFGYVSEVSLERPGDKSKIIYHDSDNDGLWTAMYGAGECFAYAATGDAKAKDRARRAFEALRFLQKVPQGSANSPPRGYVARTIRSTSLPDPNRGRFEHDRRNREENDSLWKVYQPRWPKSADGKWYWKSDTSSDELDGHYFFYPLYYDLVADGEAEKERVREVVKDLTDHLINHGFNLVDHDGTPTRWGYYAPESMNYDPHWWAERGLKSLSMLSYLAVAEHVTEDPVYREHFQRLVDEHAYGTNAMIYKIHRGPGSGNHSDDEMAFMCYYNLLKYGKDPALRRQMLLSFFNAWANEQPEMNPFFNFAYAGARARRRARRSMGNSFACAVGRVARGLHGNPSRAPARPPQLAHEEQPSTRRRFPAPPERDRRHHGRGLAGDRTAHQRQGDPRRESAISTIGTPTLGDSTTAATADSSPAGRCFSCPTTWDFITISSKRPRVS